MLVESLVDVAGDGELNGREVATGHKCNITWHDLTPDPHWGCCGQ